jgi:5'-nucleotidase
MRDLRILVSNDDGIHAPGLKALEKIARKLSKDVWVVAPDSEQSGASHSLTLSEPLRIRKISARRHAVSGTPTDCVMMALNVIIKGRRPDLVLSGVNRGGNLGEDVTYSGTVAAAMEGTLLDVPSIALSQCFGWYGNRKVPWATAEAHAPGLIERLVDVGWPRDCLINVNFPDCDPGQVTGVEVTVQGRRDANDLLIEQRTDARLNPYSWIGFRRTPYTPAAGTDLAAVSAGRISVTPLHLDLTHFATRDDLAAALAARPPTA